MRSLEKKLRVGALIPSSALLCQILNVAATVAVLTRLEELQTTQQAQQLLRPSRRTAVVQFEGTGDAEDQGLNLTYSSGEGVSTWMATSGGSTTPFFPQPSTAIGGHTTNVDLVAQAQAQAQAQTQAEPSLDRPKWNSGGGEVGEVGRGSAGGGASSLQSTPRSEQRSTFDPRITGAFPYNP